MFEGQDPKEIFKDCEEEEELSDEELFEREFIAHKRDYYINKMKYPDMTECVNSLQQIKFNKTNESKKNYFKTGMYWPSKQCATSLDYSGHYDITIMVFVLGLGIILITMLRICRMFRNLPISNYNTHWANHFYHSNNYCPYCQRLAKNYCQRLIIN